MSINKVFNQSKALDFEKYNFMLNKFDQVLVNSYSMEESVYKEGEVFDYIQSLEDLERFVITEFSQFRSRDLVLNENIIKDSFDISQIQTVFLRRLFISNFNETKILVEGIVGKIKRIKQKQAALDLWDDNYIKYAISEKFNNFDNLKYNLVSGEKLEVNTTQGVLTLPVKSEKNLTIQSLSISSGNGNPGNSDIEVEYQSQLLANAIDGDSNSWFEYERLDNGPVEVTFVVELKEESILNYIEVLPFGGESVFKIKEIKYSGNSRDYKSIKDLSLVESDNFYYAKELSGGQVWNISFLPIRVKSFSITFESNYSEIIKVRGPNGVANRKRYSVGIKEIIPKQIEYQTSGSINSETLNIAENVYIGEVELKSIPENTNLYDLKIDVSTNSGDSWSEDSLENSFIVEGSGLVYKVFLERKDKAFSNATTFEIEEDNSYLKTKSKVASKKISPNTITIHEKTTEDEIFVYQDSKLKLSLDSREGVLFYKNRKLNSKLFSGTANGSFLTVEMPANLERYNLFSEDLEIFVDGERFEEVQKKTELTQDGNYYYLDENLDRILFSKDRIDYGSRIKYRLKPQDLFFFKGEKGFYARFNNYFDPNKSNIQIECLTGEKRKVSEQVNKNKQTIKLNRKGIVKESIVFEGRNIGTFSLQTEKDNVEQIGNIRKYYFNERNSLLFVPNLNLDGSLRVNYEVNEVEKIEEDQYEVWFEEGTPKGIYVKDEFFKSSDIEETLSLTLVPVKKYSLREQISVERKDNFWNNRRIFTLQNRNIVGGTVRLTPQVFGETESLKVLPVEVPFIDGHSEFLNLKRMDNEKTSRIFSDNAGKVSFLLAARSKFHPELGIVFEGNQFLNFVNTVSDVNSFGDYFVDGNGKVTVYIGVNEYLEENQNIEYYYVDYVADFKYKFSVNYNEGILYLSEDANISEKSKVRYKTSDYSAGYQIVDKISNFRYNKESRRIEVDSGYLKENSKNLNVAYLVKDIKVTLEEMKRYFTPFIDRISFRFK